jgi:hypothetical protein
LLYPDSGIVVVFMSMIRITDVAAQTRATRPIRRRLRIRCGRPHCSMAKSATLLHVRVQNRWLEQGGRRRKRHFGMSEDGHGVE